MRKVAATIRHQGVVRSSIWSISALTSAVGRPHIPPSATSSHAIHDMLLIYHLGILPPSGGIPAAHVPLMRRAAEVRGSRAEPTPGLPAQSRRAPPRCCVPRSRRRGRRIRKRCRRRRLGSCAADTATPRSTPTTDPSPGPTAGSGATANATCHRPARSRVIRQDFAATGTGRDQRNRTQPVFGTRTAPTWRDRRRTSLGCSCTIRNPSSRPALRHVGRRCVPAKKFVIAWAWSRIACCCTITLPSASHWLFSRAAVSCRHRSANRGIGPRPGRHQDSCSTHRFHTYLASAQCRSSATSSVRDS
jgi:hypothetical protein